MTPERSPSLPGETVAAFVGVIVPGSAPGAKRLITAMEAEWERARSVALRAAERESGMMREELADRIADNPRLIPLVTRLLHAAGMNLYDPVLTAMGEALGRALSDEGALDESTLLVTTLDGLTPAHMQALKILENPPLDSTPDRPKGWINTEMYKEPGVISHVLDMALGGLVFRGLAISSFIHTDASDQVGYAITELGREVLHLVRTHRAHEAL
jgi:hypothetical protein